MFDTNLILQSAVTKVTDFLSAGTDLKTGTPRRGMVARFLVSSHISVGTTGSVWRPEVHESSDNTTFTVKAAGEPFTSGTAAAVKEAFVPFTTKKRYIAPKIVLVTSAGTPAIIYSVDCGNAHP